MGISTDSITHDQYSLILSVAIFTMVLTPFVSNQTARLYALRKRFFKHEALETINIPTSGLHGHVIVAGGGRIGRQIGHALEEAKVPFVILEQNHHRVEILKASGIPVVYGDASQEFVLEAAGLNEAQLFVITVPEFVVARTIALHVKKTREEVPLIVRASDTCFVRDFLELGAETIILPELEAGLEMTRDILVRLGLSVDQAREHVKKQRQLLLGKTA